MMNGSFGEGGGGAVDGSVGEGGGGAVDGSVGEGGGGAVDGSVGEGGGGAVDGSVGEGWGGAVGECSCGDFCGGVCGIVGATSPLLSVAECEGANDTSEVEGLETCAETRLVSCQDCQEEASVSSKQIYDTIVHWRKRFFLVPNGSAGSDFVKELTRSLQQYIDTKGDHGDALFLFFSLPSLMLQRSSEHSKTKDDVKTLRR